MNRPTIWIWSPSPHKTTDSTSSRALFYLPPVTIRLSRPQRTVSSSSCQTAPLSTRYPPTTNTSRMMRWQENVRYTPCHRMTRATTKLRSFLQNHTGALCQENLRHSAPVFCSSKFCFHSRRFRDPVLRRPYASLGFRYSASRIPSANAPIIPGFSPSAGGTR